VIIWNYEIFTVYDGFITQIIIIIIIIIIILGPTEQIEFWC